MSRFPDLHTRPKHDITQTNLEMMIRDLRITLDAHEVIGTLQRVRAIATIREARRDVQRCSTPFDDLIKRHSIAEFRWPDHMRLIEWLTSLSIDLIKMSEPDKYKGVPGILIGPGRLDAGLRLVQELDGCREKLRFER